MIDAVEEFGIPIENINIAHNEWEDVKYSFVKTNDGKNGYLLSNNDTYIKTDVILDGNCTIKSRLTTNSECRPFGYYDGGNSSKNFSVALTVRYDGNALNNILTTFNKELLTLNQNGLFKNSAKIATLSYKSFICPDKMYIGHTNPKTLSGGGGNNEYSYVNVTKNDTTIGHFVPFFRNGKYGLIDLVSMVFYDNANTIGSFGYALR